MSEHKVAGCCTVCDKKIFEVRSVFESHHPRAGEPRELGRSLADSVRVMFGLYDGSRADFGFCGDCANKLSASQYHWIWRKALRSFIREGADKNVEHQKWFLPQYANGILLEIGRVLLRDLEAK